MDYLERYRYPIIGGIIDGIAAVVIFTIGSWTMILLLILISLAVMAGSF
ncbi:DUF2273 domain-containing protein [Lactococcus muris]|uniref:DUF2273 domain-containing protein n=1 Tax=Lactococcus muris TaxID=2941330 RepID=A0ABV4DCM0_9LACT